MANLNFKVEYKFNQEQLLDLEEKGIINWCGGKWWINFDLILRQLIKTFKDFLPEKWQWLFENMQKICYSHDYDFYLWWWFYNFLRANFRFWKNLFFLLSWARFRDRIWIAFFAFIMLCIFWKKYFNWKK